MADHLLDCFWDRVYCLYPFFDRPSFQDAYEDLWMPRSQPSQKKHLSPLNIGLGNVSNSGTHSTVFVCALNMIFAIGCHFADIPVVEREAVAHSFFQRAKQHIGLDMLDIRTIGVVQTLLVTTLYLQSTPYPHRCWNLIGVACRLAQGLGLHEAKQYEFKDVLEQEIQRRTWHGCVMMNMIVSMTYGRPSMTSHLPGVPLPGALDLIPFRESHGPPLMTFYVATIELYHILDCILSDVYHTWRGRSSATPTVKHGALDIIIELEEKLVQYELGLPWFLNWTGRSPSDSPQSSLGIDPSRRLVLERQRNVLHARFLYLHLLLYRPIFTQVCSEGTHTHPRQHQHPQSHSQVERRSIQGTLQASIRRKCAAACVQAAIDLVSLVFDIHQSSTAADTWWYNGFYSATAAMVLIMSHTGRTILEETEEIDQQRIDSTWNKCEQILQHMVPFSLSARNTLQFLQGVYAQVVSNANTNHNHNSSATTGTWTGTGTGEPIARGGHEITGQQQPIHNNSNHTNIHTHPSDQAFNNTMSFPDLSTGEVFNGWDTTLGLGLASDELGFLGPFDFNELQGWLPDGV